MSVLEIQRDTATKSQRVQEKEIHMNGEMTTGEAPQAAPDFKLLIVSYDDEQGAGKALTQVLAARREKRVATPAVASVRKDAAGAVEINEPGDIGGVDGAVAGGLVGGLLGGLFGRRALAGAALGAALGALGASKHDAGIPNPRLAEIGAGLPAGSSAFVAIVEEGKRTDLQSLLGAGETHIAIESIALDLDVARQLKEGQYGEALGSLANQAEGLIGEAKGRVTEFATSFGKKGGGDAEAPGSRGPEEQRSGGAEETGAGAAIPEAQERST
jgi:uncharacterized membrane protein